MDDYSYVNKDYLEMENNESDIRSQIYDTLKADIQEQYPSHEEIDTLRHMCDFLIKIIRQKVNNASE